MTNEEGQQPAEEEASFDEGNLSLHRDKYLEHKAKLAVFEREKKGLESVEQDLMKSISGLLYGDDKEQNVQRVMNVYSYLTLQELRERHEEARFLSVWDIREGNKKRSNSLPNQLETLVILTVTLATGMILLTEFVWKTGSVSLFIVVYSVSISIGALAILEILRGVISRVRKTQEE